ncbi:MAG TPA: sugar transferase [Acidobacteria bacterium]|nr:sugar transferase [Acidobacteriota bacterium]
MPAAVALLLLAPLLLTAALLVLVTKGRPVLFVQVRSGRHFERLRLFKLRTMHDYVGADGRVAPVEVRLSAVGRWLRRFRIDELFQLLNVVRGEMALIGPRPLVREELAEMPDGGRGRLLVRPGITGWAQVCGGNDLSPREKYALDMWYIAEASPGLDLRIVWRTLLMMARGERRDERAIGEALARLGEGRSVAGAPPARRLGEVA